MPRKKKKPPYWLYALIIILLVVSHIGVYFLGYRKQYQSLVVADPPPLTEIGNLRWVEEDVADWPTYEPAGMPFTVKYPSYWTTNKLHSRAFALLTAKQLEPDYKTSNAEQNLISFAYLKCDGTPNQYCNNDLQGAIDERLSWLDYPIQSDIVVDGHPGIKLEGFSSSISGFYTYDTVVIIPVGEDMIVAEITNRGTQSLFDKIIDTIRIKG